MHFQLGPWLRYLKKGYGVLFQNIIIILIIIITVVVVIIRPIVTIVVAVDDDKGVLSQWFNQ